MGKESLHKILTEGGFVEDIIILKNRVSHHLDYLRKIKQHLLIKGELIGEDIPKKKWGSFGYKKESLSDYFIVYKTN